jgi:hypothetical protein
MNPITLSLTRLEYRYIRELCHCCKVEIKAEYQFGGYIDYRTIIAEMCKNPKHFQKDDADLFYTTKPKHFLLKVYEFEAVFFLLRDVLLPSEIEKVKTEMRKDITLYRPTLIESAIEQWYNRSLKEEFDGLELRELTKPQQTWIKSRYNHET